MSAHSEDTPREGRVRSAGTSSVMSLVALLAVQDLAVACPCLWDGPFAKVAVGQELVLQTEVQDHYKHSMDVKVNANGHGIALSPTPASVPDR